MQETQVRSLGWEDTLEWEMATHSSILAWEIPWAEKPGRPETGVSELAMTEHTHVLFGYGSAGGGWGAVLRPAHLAWPRGAAPHRGWGRNWEDPMPGGRRQRGVTPRPWSGAVAKIARLQQRRNRQEELPHVRGQGRRPGGDTQRPRRGGCRDAGGSRGAIPCSRSGGAAVRRYPSFKVRSSVCALLEQPWKDTSRPRRETQVRWWVLQEGIRGQTHWNHTHRKPVNLITLGPQPCLTQWN